MQLLHRATRVWKGTGTSHLTQLPALAAALLQGCRASVERLEACIDWRSLSGGANSAASSGAPSGATAQAGAGAATAGAAAPIAQHNAAAPNEAAATDLAEALKAFALLMLVDAGLAPLLLRLGAPALALRAARLAAFLPSLFPDCRRPAGRAQLAEYVGSAYKVFHKCVQTPGQAADLLAAPLDGDAAFSQPWAAAQLCPYVELDLQYGNLSTGSSVLAYMLAVWLAALSCGASAFTFGPDAFRFVLYGFREGCWLIIEAFIGWAIRDLGGLRAQLQRMDGEGIGRLCQRLLSSELLVAISVPDGQPGDAVDGVLRGCRGVSTPAPSAAWIDYDSCCSSRSMRCPRIR